MTDDKLEADVDSSKDIVLKIDAKKKITFASPAVATLGYEASDVVGLHIMELLACNNMYEALCKMTTRRTGARSSTNYPVRLQVNKDSPTLAETPFMEFMVDAYGLWEKLGEEPQDKDSESEFLGTLIIARAI